MNPTLVSLAHTLRQVAPLMGPRISPHGAFVAGVCALALGVASSANAQSVGVRDIGASQTKTDVSSQDLTSPQSQHMSEQSARNVGRAVGGVLGYMVGRATDASSSMKAVLTVGGLLVGDQVAKQQSQQAQGAAQEGAALAGNAQAGSTFGSGQPAWAGKVDPTVLAAISTTGNPGSKPRPGTQPLTADLAQGMNDLVLDAVAHRFLAQEAWTTAYLAASNAAVRPRDAAAAQTSARAAQNFKEVMRRNNESFYWFRNAVGTLERSGFDVDRYLVLNRVLSQNVDRNGMVALGHPSIRLKVDELEGRQAAGRADLTDLQAHSKVSPEAYRAER
jgi:hypothetical protein